eukprot:gene29017-35024_t
MADAAAKMANATLTMEALLVRLDGAEKTASEAGSCWYNQYVTFSKFDDIASIDERLLDQFESFVTRCRPFLVAFVDTLMVNTNDKSEAKVQSAYEVLISQIITPRVSHSSSDVIDFEFMQRLVTTDIENFLENSSYKKCIITGKPDASVMFMSVPVSITELKSIDLLRTPAKWKAGLVQLSLYAKGDSESLARLRNFFFPRVCHLLCDGSTFVLLVQSSSQTVDTDGKKGVQSEFYHTTPCTVEWANVKLPDGGGYNEDAIRLVLGLFFHVWYQTLINIDSLKEMVMLKNMKQCTVAEPEEKGDGKGPSRGGNGGSGNKGFDRKTRNNPVASRKQQIDTTGNSGKRSKDTTGTNSRRMALADLSIAEVQNRQQQGVAKTSSGLDRLKEMIRKNAASKVMIISAEELCDLDIDDDCV